jgi:hypothetical protein
VTPGFKVMRHRFQSNEVRLGLSVLAYNLGNLWRRLVLVMRIGHWSLTSLQQRPVKTGGRLVKHARYYWLLLAESHLTRRLFGRMLQRIASRARDRTRASTAAKADSRNTRPITRAQSGAAAGICGRTRPSPGRSG